MSTLIMVRHGQASFGASDYDKLSDMGVAQSVKLGEYWVRQGVVLDGTFSGAQIRQQDTLKAVSDVYRSQDLPFPEFGMTQAFNEYDGDSIMKSIFPQVVAQEPRLQGMLDQVSGSGANTPEGRKAFQEIFQVVMNRWLRGDLDVEGVESWEQFRGRVIQGVKRIVEENPSGKTVAIFTSGGPISAVLQHALEMPDRVALDMGWVIKNASLTEFRYSGDRFTLTGFNLTPHFEEDAFITYR